MQFSSQTLRYVYLVCDTYIAHGKPRDLYQFIHRIGGGALFQLSAIWDLSYNLWLHAIFPSPLSRKRDISEFSLLHRNRVLHSGSCPCHALWFRFGLLSVVFYFSRSSCSCFLYSVQFLDVISGRDGLLSVSPNLANTASHLESLNPESYPSLFHCAVGFLKKLDQYIWIMFPSGFLYFYILLSTFFPAFIFSKLDTGSKD